MSIRFRRLIRSNSSTTNQKRFKKCPAQFCNVSSSKKHRCRKARESTHSFTGFQMPDPVRGEVLLYVELFRTIRQNVTRSHPARPRMCPPAQASVCGAPVVSKVGSPPPRTPAVVTSVLMPNASSPCAQLLWLSAVPSVVVPAAPTGAPMELLPPSS